MRVGVLSSGNGYGHCWVRNGEFCVAGGPVTRTLAHWPSWLKSLAVNGAGHPADLGRLVASPATAKSKCKSKSTILKSKSKSKSTLSGQVQVRVQVLFQKAKSKSKSSMEKRTCKHFRYSVLKPDHRSIFTLWAAWTLALLELSPDRN